MRTEEAGEEGYDLWVPTEGLAPLWDRLRDAGARPVGREAWDVLRVEAGVVRYGIDVDASTLLLEAPLTDAYSLTKGCYVGQEVVARITYRGHVNRQIVGFRFLGARVPAAGAPVLVEGKEVGRITSAVLSPALGVALGLGFLRREHHEPGTRVEVQDGGDVALGRGRGAALLPADPVGVSHDDALTPRARAARPTAWPTRRAPTSSSTRTTRSTGTPGARRRSSGPAREDRPHPALHRLLGLPLVPRHGARVVRGPGRSRG